MIEGFDREIDVFLRRAAQGETVSAAENQESGGNQVDSAHLDADELSALAENALPEKVLQIYVLHLADCERCRKDLADLIRLNSEIGDEIAHFENASLPDVAIARISWYRKLFAVPNLAYAMGILVLIFGGIAAFTVLQKNNSSNSQISQMSEKQIGGKGMSSDGDAATQEVYSNRTSSNSMMTNSAVSTNSAMNSAIPAAPVSAANANATTRSEAAPLPKNERKDDKSTDDLKKSNELAASVSVAAPPSQSAENNFQVDGQEKEQSPLTVQNQSVQNQAQNQTQISPDTRSVQRAPMPVAKMNRQKIEDSAGLNAKPVATTTVGGKTFQRAADVWVDTAYRGQATINVTRGTKEYKKLDSGLRAIAENLGGKIVIVWKEKAYRIQ